MSPPICSGATWWLAVSVFLVCISDVVADTFQQLDLNGDGVLDRKEFAAVGESFRLYIDQVFGSSPANNGMIMPHLTKNKAIAEVLEFWPAFINSFAMILVTELGDKTFFIAAIMAMRHPRLIVFAGAIGALIVMTILSALMGFALPSVLPRQYTHYAGGLLFLYFGVKLLNDARGMDATAASEELEEVEAELMGKKDEEDEAQQLGDAEGGFGAGGKPRGGSRGGGSGEESALADKIRLKVFTQAFTLTFLAEWGDRSQIATIALAAAKDPFGVTVGGVLGHSCCTGLAVVGGRMLASRISERTVALVGGALFLIFGIHSFIAGP